MQIYYLCGAKSWELSMKLTKKFASKNCAKYCFYSDKNYEGTSMCTKAIHAGKWAFGCTCTNLMFLTKLQKNNLIYNLIF